MLSEEAKQELKALASSRQLRQDFERVRVAAQMFPLPAPRVPTAYKVARV